MSGQDSVGKCAGGLREGAFWHADEAELRGYAIPSRSLGTRQRDSETDSTLLAAKAAAACSRGRRGVSRQPTEPNRQHRTSRESGDRNALRERSPNSANRCRRLRGWDELCESGPWAGGYRRCANGYMLLPLSRPGANSILVTKLWLGHADPRKLCFASSRRAHSTA